MRPQRTKPAQHLAYETRILNLIGPAAYAQRLQGMRERFKTYLHPTTQKRNRFARRIAAAERLLRAAKFVNDGTEHMTVHLNTREADGPLDGKTAKALGQLFRTAYVETAKKQMDQK